MICHHHRLSCFVLLCLTAIKNNTHFSVLGKLYNNLRDYLLFCVGVFGSFCLNMAVELVRVKSQLLYFRPSLKLVHVI